MFPILLYSILSFCILFYPYDFHWEYPMADSSSVHTTAGACSCVALVPVPVLALIFVPLAASLFSNSSIVDRPIALALAQHKNRHQQWCGLS